MIVTNKIGNLEYLTAEGIPVPHCFTTRLGGVSTGSLSSLNLGLHRGDDPDNVAENYRRLGAALGFLGTGTVTLLTVISAATVFVVIAGLYVGYHMGYEQKTKAYFLGGLLLIIAGIDVIIRYIVLG